MKSLFIYIAFLVLSNFTLTAGKLNEKLYMDVGKDILGQSGYNFDSTGNLWYGTKKSFWLVNKAGDSIKHIDKIVRGTDTVWYNKYTTDEDRIATIAFGEETAIANCHDTILYITADKILKFDKSFPFFKNTERKYPVIDKAFYIDSTYYCFILPAKRYTYPFDGIVKFDTRTEQWSEFKFFSYSDIKESTNFIYSNRFMFKYDSSLVYTAYSCGLVFINDTTSTLLDFREVFSDYEIISTHSYCRRNDLIYISTTGFQLFKYNLRTNSYEVEDLTKTPMYTDNIKLNPELKINIWEANDRYMLAYNTNCSRSNLLYIKFKDKEWEKIPMDKFSKYMKMGPPNLILTPEKDRLWFGFISATQPDTTINDIPYHYFLTSYDIFEEPDAIEDTDQFTSLNHTKLYPNPTKKYINLEFSTRPNLRDKMKFEIYDYMGRKVKELDASYAYNTGEDLGIKQIDVEEINSGIYFLLIDNGRDKSCIRFVIE